METHLIQAMRLLTMVDVVQYLLSNTNSRMNGAKKAHHHEQLCSLYIAVFRNIEPDKVRLRYESLYKIIHDETARQLTDVLDEVIGFDMDGYVDDKTQEKFFLVFHKIASEILLLDEF